MERISSWTLAAPKTGAVAAVNPQPKGQEMTWLLALLNLVPVIAQGIQTLHADKGVATKTQMASDALNLAVAGAKAVAPPGEQALVDGVGTIAQQTLATTVAQLHSAPTPAPAATA